MELQAESGQADVARCARPPTASASARSRCRSSAPPASVSLRFPVQPGGEAAQSAVVKKAREAFGGEYNFRRVETVGPRVSGELVQSGTIGVVLSVIAVLIYLWFRFEQELAIGAIIGTLHDIVLALGFFVITRHEFNMTSIAAILTIVGYSLNETVVVFDRTRELMRRYKTHPDRGPPQPVDQLDHVAHGDDRDGGVPVAPGAGAVRRAGDRGLRPGHAVRRGDLHLLGDLRLDAGADLLGLHVGARSPSKGGALPQPAE